MRRQDRAQRLKESVIAAFFQQASDAASGLAEFSARDWRKILFWLDASGLALYLLDHLTSLDLQKCLPQAIRARLQENLKDNRDRTAALLEETIMVGRSLQQQNISFALLKGLTLSPEAVPDSALRCQLDLDVLVAESEAVAAKEVVLSLGYRLHAVSGNTLEFKAGVSDEVGIENLYKVRPDRSLELHLLPRTGIGAAHIRQDRLARAQLRCFREWMLPALSPADSFLQQALHLFKHICSEHTRAAWVLEFWRHVLARRDDAEFWREVESLATGEEHGDVAIGAVTLLATKMFGEFAPKELSRWTLDRLPPAVRLWIETYGRRAVLADFPGSKLYLLLRAHLQAENSSRQAVLRRLVFPMRLPPRITHGAAGERLLARFKRFRIEAGFIFFRLRFHVVEGFRYAVESSRWQRRLTGISN